MRCWRRNTLEKVFNTLMAGKDPFLLLAPGATL